MQMKTGAKIFAINLKKLNEATVSIWKTKKQEEMARQKEDIKSGKIKSKSREKK